VELEESVVIMNKNIDKSKGYGFVTFKHIDGAMQHRMLGQVEYTLSHISDIYTKMIQRCIYYLYTTYLSIECCVIGCLMLAKKCETTRLY